MVNTYINATGQFPAQKDGAILKSEIPIREIVGAITRGPMYCNSFPTTPAAPTNT